MVGNPKCKKGGGKERKGLRQKSVGRCAGRAEVETDTLPAASGPGAGTCEEGARRQQPMGDPSQWGWDRPLAEEKVKKRDFPTNLEVPQQFEARLSVGVCGGGVKPHPGHQVQPRGRPAREEALPEKSV